MLLVGFVQSGGPAAFSSSLVWLFLSLFMMLLLVLGVFGDWDMGVFVVFLRRGLFGLLAVVLVLILSDSLWLKRSSDWPSSINSTLCSSAVMGVVVVVEFVLR